MILLGDDLLPAVRWQQESQHIIRRRRVLFSRGVAIALTMTRRGGASRSE